MTTALIQDAADLAADYWCTDVVGIEPGRTHVHGYPIQELISQVGFAEIIWLMLRGELPAKRQAVLLEMASVVSVDHGPHAPPIAIVKMVTSCGLLFNGAVVSVLNVLDDVHGGAGQQTVELFHDIEARMFDGASLEATTVAGVDAFIATHGKYLPGFGYRFHPVNSWAGRLLALVDETAQDSVVGGRYAVIGRAIEALLSSRRGKPIPMNINGVTAMIYAELGFTTPLACGVFCLSRIAGVLMHAWEQSGHGECNKGPIPHQLPHRYTGHATRYPAQAEPASAL